MLYFTSLILLSVLAQRVQSIVDCTKFPQHLCKLAVSRNLCNNWCSESQQCINNNIIACPLGESKSWVHFDCSDVTDGYLCASFRNTQSTTCRGVCSSGDLSTFFCLNLYESCPGTLITDAKLIPCNMRTYCHTCLNAINDNTGESPDRTNQCYWRSDTKSCHMNDLTSDELDNIKLTVTQCDFQE